MFISRTKDHTSSPSVAEGTAFARCSDRQRRRLEQLATVVTVPAGRVLTEQGKVGHEFGVIIDGEAVVEIDGDEVARLHAGDHYGELALLERRGAGRRRATVTAVGPVTVAAMTEPEFRAAMTEMPEIAHSIVRTALERLDRRR